MQSVIKQAAGTKEPLAAKYKTGFATQGANAEGNKLTAENTIIEDINAWVNLNIIIFDMPIPEPLRIAAHCDSTDTPPNDTAKAHRATLYLPPRVDADRHPSENSNAIRIIDLIKGFDIRNAVINRSLKREKKATAPMIIIQVEADAETAPDTDSPIPEQRFGELTTISSNGPSPLKIKIPHNIEAVI